MTRRSSSSDHALGALHLLIIINILVHLFRNDLTSQLSLTKTYRIFDGNLQSMLLSMFYHLEPTHLVLNMMALYRFGNELFVNSSSRRWRSFWTVILSYIGKDNGGIFFYSGTFASVIHDICRIFSLFQHAACSHSKDLKCSPDITSINGEEN